MQLPFIKAAQIGVAVHWMGAHQEFDAVVEAKMRARWIPWRVLNVVCLAHAEGILSTSGRSTTLAVLAIGQAI